MNLPALRAFIIVVVKRTGLWLIKASRIRPCTFNTYIAHILSDHVYLELISFTKPPEAYPPSSPSRRKRDSHKWASRAPGWIDYAFLGNGSLTSLGRISDIIMIAPAQTARRSISRKCPVPTHPDSNAHHPSGALGIAHILLLISEGPSFAAGDKDISVMIVEQPVSRTTTEVKWRLSTLNGERAPTLVLTTLSDRE
ncbi:hypothetical protein B0H14DRAFT_3428563 [Mycena olivaceomarginata]|nr:hypothetical protein B0H14DRAFT_3428563 [Mycena olivaceomarginata]